MRLGDVQKHGRQQKLTYFVVYRSAGSHCATAQELKKGQINDYYSTVLSLQVGVDDDGWVRNSRSVSARYYFCNVSMWYRSTTSSFTPGSTNSLTSATSTTLVDSYQLIPNTKYYYEVVAADSTGSLASTSQILITTTAFSVESELFCSSNFCRYRRFDGWFSYNVIAAIIDTTAGTTSVLARSIREDRSKHFSKGSLALSVAQLK